MNCFRLLLVMVAAEMVAVGQTAAQLQQYDRTLAELSEPAEARWQHFGTPYFSSNEKLLNLFYSRFENAGGVTVGVSFQQNLSLLVHARPKLCVIFDYNPGLTEILVPFMGQLMAESPTRREFLSRLLGADLTADETRQLLQGEVSVPAVLTTVLERTSPQLRMSRIEKLRALLRDKYVDRLPAAATPAMRGEVLKWIEILENEELISGTFFADAISGYKLARLPEDRPRTAGWLSTEANYALVRSYWMSGKIIGVTGDISGSSVGKLAEYLRKLRLEVTTLYVSNVGLSVEGHLPGTWFRDLYATLGRLPVTPGALTLVAHGPWQLTGFVRPLKQAQWVYRTLADVPEQTMIRLHEAPLEVMTRQGNARMLSALWQGLDTLKAPQTDIDLVKAVAAKPEEIRRLTPEQFGEWSAAKIPGIDVHAADFKTMTVTLVEAGFLASPVEKF